MSSINGFGNISVDKYSGIPEDLVQNTTYFINNDEYAYQNGHRDQRLLEEYNQKFNTSHPVKFDELEGYGITQYGYQTVDNGEQILQTLRNINAKYRMGKETGGIWSYNGSLILTGIQPSDGWRIHITSKSAMEEFLKELRMVLNL